MAGTPLQEISAEEKAKVAYAVNRTIKKIGNEIGEDFRVVIKTFYSDYKPHRYKRTRSMYKFAKGVGGDNVYYLKEEPQIGIAGLRVDPSFVPGNPYEKNPPHGLYITPQNVFESSYLGGIHGFTDYYIRKNLREDPEERNGLNENQARWRKQLRRRRTPPTTTPRPDFFMRMKFRKYTYDYCCSVFKSMYY